MKRRLIELKAAPCPSKIVKSDDIIKVKYFIPIIGVISSGKSTFLKGLLHTNVLEVGATTVTKFICLIKPSKIKEEKFYKVIPQKKPGTFLKEGIETISSTNIKKRIESINKGEERKNKETGEVILPSKNNIFYMLEIPIPPINDEVPLTENFCFMDIPGLNEAKTSINAKNNEEKNSDQNINYIDIMKDIIRNELIKFEIFIFDLNFESDSVKQIIYEMNKKCSLKTEGNLIILNKMDKCKSSEDREKKIEDFQYHFYNSFEKTFGEKNNITTEKDGETRMKMSIYNNKFIPFNSLLFNVERHLKLAEMNTQDIFEDFKCLLQKEFFNYLESDKNHISFFEFLKGRLGQLLSQDKITDSGDDNLSGEEKKKDKITNSGDDNLSKEEKKKIKNAIKFINDRKFLGDLESGEDTNINIGIDSKSDKSDFLIIYKIFGFFKNKIWRINYSDQFRKISEFISEISVQKNENIQNEINVDNINKENESNYQLENENLEILEELENLVGGIFKNLLKQKEKEIEENKSNGNKGESLEFFNYLNSIRENLLMTNNRISFIGNYNIGKSTVLNCIIGKDLLPTKNGQCTNRGVILRYKDEPEFKLYKTTLKTGGRGSGYNEYNYFDDAKKYECKGVEKIKTYLSNQNKDNDITDENAFLVITGKLGIFDFFKDQKIISKEFKDKIEFIDLPGLDIKNNQFNQKGFYYKILRFTNCCVYINTHNSLDDENNYENFKERYIEDKEKILRTLRDDFISTCVFLINKVDQFTSPQKDIEKIKASLFKLVGKVEPKINEEKIISPNMKPGKEGEKIAISYNNPEKEEKKKLRLAFFSSKYILRYNFKRNLYINLIDTNPILFWQSFYDDWNKGIYNLSKFMNIISSQIENDKKMIKIYIKKSTPENFISYMKESFTIFKSNSRDKILKFKEDRLDEIIDKIYNIRNSIEELDIILHKYFYLLEIDPENLFQLLLDKWADKRLHNNNYSENFNAFLEGELSNDEKMLDIEDEDEDEDEDDEKEVKELKKLFILEAYKKFSQKNEKITKEIQNDILDKYIMRIIILNKKIYQNIFKYSTGFYQVLENAIMSAYRLRQKNFKENIDSFFKELNIDFELGEISRKQKDELQQKIKELKKNILPKFEELFDYLIKDVESEINSSRQKIILMIYDETNEKNKEKYHSILKSVNDDYKKALEKVKEEIKN